MSGPPPLPDDHRPGPLLRWGATLLLLVALWAPLVTMGLAKAGWVLPGKLDEKRTAAPWPELEKSVQGVAKWPAGFEAWFNDHFGLRTQLIKSNSIFQVLVLKTSPATPADLADRRESTVLGKGFAWPRVVVGREGWLFLAVNMDIDQNRGKVPLPDEELEKYRASLEERDAYCRIRGAKYLYVICPDKDSIYPEYLPRTVKRLPNDPRIVQVSNYMAATSKVPFVGLLPTLREARTHNEVPLYFKYNSHWNNVGAFIGAQRIIQEVNRLFPQAPLLRREDYDLVMKGPSQGDLAVMLGLDDMLIDDDWNLLPKGKPRARLCPTPFGDLLVNNRQTVAWTTEDKRLPRVLVFNDSFTPFMDEYLSESFQEVVYVWTLNFLPDLVDRYKPDLVITIGVARNTTYCAPANFPIVGQTVRAAAGN